MVLRDNQGTSTSCTHIVVALISPVALGYAGRFRKAVAAEL